MADPSSYSNHAGLFPSVEHTCQMALCQMFSKYFSSAVQISETTHPALNLAVLSLSRSQGAGDHFSIDLASGKKKKKNRCQTITVRSLYVAGN